MSLVSVALETQSSFVLSPGHTDSSNNRARALGSSVPPKPSAKQMDVTGKGFKKEEKPSGENRLCTRWALTTVCTLPWEVHEGPGFLATYEASKPCRTALGWAGACWGMQTPWASRVHQTQGKLYTWLEVVGKKARYKGLIQEEGGHHHTAPEKLKAGWKGSTCSPSINRLWHPAAAPGCVHCTPFPEEQ